MITAQVEFFTGLLTKLSGDNSTSAVSQSYGQSMDFEMSFFDVAATRIRRKRKDRSEL